MLFQHKRARDIKNKNLTKHLNTTKVDYLSPPLLVWHTVTDTAYGSEPQLLHCRSTSDGTSIERTRHPTPHRFGAAQPLKILPVFTICNPQMTF